MPTAYEQSYGEVTFYTLAGTKIYAMTADLGMWLAEDTEPSPEPKWVRVDVPGADGAVDLSRALAGQVTYHQREVVLRFAGKKSDHSTALTTVRNLRKALHGARCKVETMLTKLSSGHYIADLECDGVAHTDGTVEVTVLATCDPFIRTGTQTLSLAGTTKTTQGPYAAITTPAAALLKGAGWLDATWQGGSAQNPIGATTAHLWWARTANLIDPSLLTVRGWVSTDSGSTWSPYPVTVDGQAIVFGDLDEANDYEVDIITSPRYPAKIETTGIPFAYSRTDYGSGRTFAVYVSGDVATVDDPQVHYAVTSSAWTDASGRLSGVTSSGAETHPTTPAASTSYGDELMAYRSVTANYRNQAFTVKLGGITATGVSVRVALLNGSVTPGAWVPADLGSATVDFGGEWGYLYGNADTAVIAPTGVTTTHRCRQTGNPLAPVAVTPYTTEGSVDGWPPSDATALCLSAVNAYGEECASNLLKATSYAIGTKSGSNTTMRSTPSVTSTGGAYVSIGGREAIVGAGTVELQGLTVPGGSFSVGYATLDGASATLTWEGGVL